jgi:DNA polymerase I-like protein with 3'-5' exonuclease and polymerase domains
MDWNKDTEFIAIDTETYGLEITDKPFAISMTDDQFNSLYWEWDTNPQTRQPIVDPKDIKQINKLLKGCTKFIFHNMPFDVPKLESVGVKLRWRNHSYDTGVLSHLFDNEVHQRHNGKLKPLSFLYCNIPDDDEEDLRHAVSRARLKVKDTGLPWAIADKDKVKDHLAVDYWVPRMVAKILGLPRDHEWWNICGTYAKTDTERTAALYVFFSQKMSKWSDSDPRHEILERERRVTEIVTDIKVSGFSFFSKKAKRSVRAYKESTAKSLSGMRTLLNDSSFNVESPKQIAAALYDKFGLPVIKKTKSGAPSTDKEVREELLERSHLMKNTKSNKVKREFIQHWNKYKTEITFVKYLSGYIDSDQGNRIYPSLNQTGTVTTRFSSQNPNGQNAKKGDKEQGIRGLRDVFGPQKNRQWFCLDYSQLQLRIFAYLTGEKSMIEAFEAGHDFHGFIASKIFKKEIDEVTKLERRIGKNCFHPDTEILTVNGWKKIEKVNKLDWVAEAIPSSEGRNEVKIKFVNPTDIIKKQNTTGKLIHFKNEGIDIRVTEDHRMLTWDQPGNIKRKGMKDSPIVSSAADTPVSRSWSNAGWHDGCYSVDEIDIRIAAMIQADGSYCSNKIRFGFTKKSKIKRSQKLLNEKGVEYTVKVNKQGVTRFSISKDDVKNSTLLLTDDKVWHPSILGLSNVSAGILLDEIKYWDANLSKGKCTMTKYYSSIKENVDLIQALATMNGRKTRLVKTENGKNVSFSLSIKNRASSKGGTVSKTEIEYHDEVVCVSVPSGFIVVRDGGVPIISGNCNFGFIFGASPKKIEATAGVAGLWDTVMRMFPSAKRMMEATKKQVKEKGYVTTPHGYRLYCNSPHKGVNYIVQGCEGDIVKTGMVNCDNYLSELQSNGFSGFITFQVHDELIFDFPVQNPIHVTKTRTSKDFERIVVGNLKKLMEKPGTDIGMVTPVDIEVTRTDWSEVQDYKLVI